MSPRKRKPREVLSLRLPLPMLARIDAVLKTYPYKLPRHIWMVESIAERLERDENRGAKKAAAGRA